MIVFVINKHGRALMPCSTRKARFLNRISAKKKGQLPPSIQSRIQNTFSWIDKFVSLLPNPKLIIEVGKFDVKKMLNPDIEAQQYQQGELGTIFFKRAYLKDMPSLYG